MLHFRHKPLPEPAERFLTEYAVSRSKNTINLYRAALHHFYRFLAQARFDIQSLNAAHFTEFDEDLARHNLQFVTRKATIGHVRIFIQWLENLQEIPAGTTHKLFPDFQRNNIYRQQSVLPELACRFIEVLGTTSKPATVSGYQSCLRGFYKHHWKTGKPPYKIDRTDIENYALHLNERGIETNQRISRMVQVRRYLYWLYEHKKLKTDPDTLITGRDFPRKEERLPRPFPVAVDLEIQRRLWESNAIDHLGLLLMRRCGLRIGELRNLTIDCIGEDLNGHWFLKVPLGKLNNERVFPLDPKTVEVIEKIKRHHTHRPEPGTNTVYLISNPMGKRRGAHHFGPVLQELAKGLAIPGKVTPHRLRHSFATSLLSAGLSVTSLKVLLGHRDIRMTLNYAAITQEALRAEYFTALSRTQARYEAVQFPLAVPDLRAGVNRSFYDAQKYIKKFVTENGNPNPQKLTKLLMRLNSLRHEFSVLLKTDFHSK